MPPSAVIPEAVVYQDPTVLQILASYWFDWLLITAGFCGYAAMQKIRVTHRYVDQQYFNLTVNYPTLKTATFPSKYTPLVAVILPALVFFVFFIIHRRKGELHRCVVGLLSAVMLTALVTEGLKASMGRPRPDFFHRCFPDSIPVFGHSGNVRCTNTHAEVNEAFKSFPSGHASWCFAGLTFLSLYLAGKLRIFMADGGGHLPQLAMVVWPLAGAAAVSATRVRDYMHHWSDVVTGGLLGLIIATVSFHQHFPPMTSPSCDVPYPHPSRKSQSKQFVTTSSNSSTQLLPQVTT